MNQLIVRAANAMGEFDWGKLAIEAGASLLSGIGGLVIGAWKWGRNSARSEQVIKDDYNGKIRALREEMRKDMAAHAQKSADGNDLLVGQFTESFAGIRRQLDEHRLTTEKEFLRKDDFRDFREEYREDIREIKAAISRSSG